MKKFFLIPLLACSFCAMAFATVHEVADYDQLKAAIKNAANGDEIRLTKDINYGTVGYASNLNIKKSLTIDGQGHALIGAGQRQSGNSQYATIWVNLNGTDSVAVTFKDIQIVNSKGSSATYAIQTRGLIKSLTLNNVFLQAYEVPLQIGGYQESKAKIQLDDCYLYTPQYYCLLSWNPYELVANNTKFEGWNALYFKGENGSTGSEGTVAVANNCKFNCPNYNSGTGNSFGMFVCEDDGISVTLNNCSMDAEQFGDQYQWILVLSEFALSKDRVKPVALTINGDNTYINGLLLDNAWCTTSRWTLSPYKDHNDAVVPSPFPLSITISGGTYNFNPEQIYWYKNSTLDEPEKSAEANKGRIIIPEGYEVKEIKTQQGDQETILYRVRTNETATKEIEVVDEVSGDTVKVEVPCSLNDSVAGEGNSAGNNPTSSFDVATGDTVSLDNETTTAGYIQLQNNVEVDEITGDTLKNEPTTIQVGKVENEGTEDEVKIDQTLVVNNGLDIQGESQLVVQAGSSVIVGEGGIITENEGNIVLEANEEESVAFLLAPEVVVNTTPLATYKFKSKAKKVGDVYTWQRFGIPTFDGKTTMSWDNSVLTALFEFNYSKNGWDRIYLGNGPVEVEGIPFQCYDMTNGSETEIEYTFTGKLMGNVDAKFDFEKGWNYYANCYTAPVDLKSFIGDLMEKYGDNEADNQIAATIYLFDREDLEGWTPITWAQLRRSSYAGPKDIKPMQAFIMQLTKGDKTEDGINYRDNVFDPLVNPGAAGAPARVKEDEFNAVDIVVSNGVKNDKMTLFEEPTLSEAFDNGWDAEKFEDNGVFSLYRESNGKKWQDYGSNDLSDQFITFETKEAGEYTMTFSGVDGKVMNLYDAVADKLIEMKEGEEYKFTAEAIKDAERFQINPKAPTGIDEIDGLAPRTTKFIGQDGQLYIRRAGNVYTVQGQNIK